jgi:RHS repeat-associated protein
MDILRETRPSGAVSFIHGAHVDEPLAREEAGNVLTFYHADALGSIVKTTNEAGEVVDSYSYDAYGNLETPHPGGYAFTGREWDPETGLYYYRARYYDPRVVRFLSVDPIGLAGGLNVYSYVGNDPVSRRDPTGLDWADNIRDWLLDESIIHDVIVGVGRLEQIAQRVVPHEHAPDDPLTIALATARAEPWPLPVVACGVSVRMRTLPSIDATGKVHGQLPKVNELSKFSDDELRVLQGQLRQSVPTRIRTIIELGPDKAHGQRLAAEQELLRQIEKYLQNR